VTRPLCQALLIALSGGMLLARHDVAAVTVACSFDNEPLGMSVVSDWGFDEDPPQSGDNQIGTSGWGINYNSPPGNPQGWVVRVSDDAAPCTPTNEYDFVYPQGMIEGDAPATVYRDVGNAAAVFFAFWWKPSSPFDLGPNGNKVGFVFNGGGGAGGQQAMVLRPDGLLHVLPEYRRDFIWRDPNVNATVVSFGTWHKVEWYANRSTGVLKWWLDGLLQGSYTNARNKYPFDEVQFSPTWGGNIGAQKQETDHYWYDQVRVSRR